RTRALAPAAEGEWANGDKEGEDGKARRETIGYLQNVGPRSLLPLPRLPMSAPTVNPPRAAQRGTAPETPSAANATNQPLPRMGLLNGSTGNRRVPPPVNEPVRSYAPGSPERAALKDRLTSMASERI